MKNQEIKIPNCLKLEIHGLSFQFINLMISSHLPVMALIVINLRHPVVDFFQIQYFFL
jgi:hypothetical protein